MKNIQKKFVDFMIKIYNMIKNHIFSKKEILTRVKKYAGGNGDQVTGLVKSILDQLEKQIPADNSTKPEANPTKPTDPNTAATDPNTAVAASNRELTPEEIAKIIEIVMKDIKEKDDYLIATTAKVLKESFEKSLGNAADNAIQDLKDRDNKKKPEMECSTITESENKNKIGKLRLKVFPYDVNDGKNSQKFRIANYRVSIDNPPYSTIDNMDNVLKNLLRFEKKEGTFRPVYDVNGNDIELWFPNSDILNGNFNNGLPWKKLIGKFGTVNGVNLNDDDLPDNLDEEKEKDTKIIDALKNAKFSRRLISLSDFAKEKILVNEDIEIDIEPFRATSDPEAIIGESNKTGGGGGKKKSKMYTLDFDIFLVKRHLSKCIAVTKQKITRRKKAFRQPKKQKQQTRKKLKEMLQVKRRYK